MSRAKRRAINDPLLAGASTCVACALLSAVAAGAEIDAAKWSHSAPILVSDGQGALAEFAIPAALHDATRGAFADLRIVDEEGRQIPYAIVYSPSTVSIEELTVRLYNRTSLADARMATIDFGKKLIKNRISVDVEGADFRREVLVEGCDDGTSWQVVRAGAVLFRASPGREVPGFERNIVEFPENDFQYLRINVRHAAGDPGPYEIEAVRAWRRAVQPAVTVPVQIVHAGVVQRKDGRLTDLEFDLGYRNLQLASVVLDFGDGNFFRHATLSGRGATHRTVRKEMEDGSVRDTQVEEAWQQIASGTIHRFSAAGNVDESLTFEFPASSGYRYVRVRIENRDDAPLTFEGAAFGRLVERVTFRPEVGGTYSVYVGNAEARRPSYDLARFADVLRAEGLREAEVGDIAVDLPQPEAETLPWSERHAWMLWVALVAIGCVLGLLVWHQVKEAEAGQKDAGKDAQK
jgi:hypothetical protein